MESAIDQKTGQIIDGEQLWYINPVDKKGYICRGCGTLVDPVSYEPHNKIRPHFKEYRKHPHEPWCNVDGEEKLVARGRKQRLTTFDGFPGSYPSVLQLTDVRRIADETSYQADSSHTTSRRDKVDRKVVNQQHYSCWTARTIRPISRTYMNFPHDRDLALSISNISGKTYDEVIQKLPSNKIILTNEVKVFAAPISWSKPQELNKSIIVELGCGLWADNKLLDPYKVVIDTSEWGIAKKNYVLKEIEVARREAIERNRKGRKNEKSWLFFLATQHPNDPSNFLLNDHRLICCLTGVMK